jgi:peptidoglycan/LPS O-acetylase OafA/YrhL
VTDRTVRVEYRADIDGLRAIAIVTVVAFHVGIPGFSGGFIGVDVFFVISGFLITKLLLQELCERTTIDLIAFFARRARRLLPAFFLVTATTLLLGSFLLSPVGEQQRLADSARASAFYVANMHFAAVGGGYFDDSSDLEPFLHTWSLAVEEQYYLIWPLLLLGAAFIARRWRLPLTTIIVGLLTIVILMSLSYSWWAAESGGRAARVAFFALSSRAWELGIGAILAVALPHLKSSNTWLAFILAGAGLLALGVSVTAFETDVPFPGVAALLPSIGTAAIIAGGTLAPNTPIARLLASKPFVVVGLLSYSWYLWHWPLLAIARSHELGILDVWRDVTIAIAALGFAFLTYIFVENPIRTRRIAMGWSNIKVLGAGAMGSLLVIAAAFVVSANAMWLSPKFDRLMQAKQDKGWSQWRCHHDDDVEFVGLISRSECMETKNPLQKILVFWGDSHADALVGALEAAVQGKFLLLPRSMSGCPPLLGVIPTNSYKLLESCSQFNEHVSAEIRQLHAEHRLAGVVTAAHWSSYFGSPALSGEAGRTLWRGGRPLTGDAALVGFADGLRRTIAVMATAGIKTLVIAPVPGQRYKATECLMKRSREFCSVPQTVAKNHRERSMRTIQEVVDASAFAYLWDPLPFLCIGGRCLVERDDVVVYRDDDHLTYSGARLLGSDLAISATWRAFIDDGS